jgi:glycerophosphoryl diester phosphodiesterase
MFVWKHDLLPFAMALFIASSVPATEIIAHRGASFDAPENTVASLRLGYEQAADAGELDITLTKDGHIVVLHDGDTARVSGITNKPAETALEDLRKLSAGQWGKWKGSKFAETIPSLQEVLAVVPSGKRIFIEVKCGPEVLPELRRVLELSRLKASQIVLIGFDLETMRQAKAKFPALSVYWLVGLDRDKKSRPLEDLLAMVKSAGVDGLDLDQGFPFDSDFVQRVHNAGLGLFAWTVDDPEVARRLSRAGVDGITTNRPGWLRGQLTGVTR